MVTTTSRHTARHAMMATSLAKTEWRNRGAWSATRTADKAVAYAPYSADEHRPLVIVAQLLAQPADQDIDRAVEGLPIDSVGPRDDAVATQDLPPVAHQETEQLEFGGRQLERPAVEPCGPGRPVDLNRAGASDLCLVLRPTPQHRLHARHQLARLEWLRQVIVRAELEADDAVGDVAARREHDDRNAAGFTH